MDPSTPAPTPKSSDLDALDPTTRHILGIDEEEPNSMRWAMAAAVVFHVILLIVTFPDLSGPQEIREPGPKKVYVVQQVRFEPPAAAVQQEVPKKRTKKIPIPDPTPDDPEPLVVEEIEELALEPVEVDVAIFGIPNAPPSTGGRGSSDTPLHLGAGITKPIKIHAPQPPYTEAARQGRIQGAVILQAIIESDGTVSEVEIIKGLPFGLDESTIETVKQWKYKPAMKGNEPVPVYMNLVINFSLQ